MIHLPTLTAALRTLLLVTGPNFNMEEYLHTCFKQGIDQHMDKIMFLKIYIKQDA